MRLWHFPVVQWLRCTFSTEGAALIPGWELRFHVLWGAAKKWKKKKEWAFGNSGISQTQMPMNFNKNSVSVMKVILLLLWLVKHNLIILKIGELRFSETF